MKLSLNWIKDYVKIPEDMDLSRLAYDLTMSTVEVEGVHDLGSQFNNIIIGIIQDSLETAINSSGDVIFAATAEFMEWKRQGREIKF